MNRRIAMFALSSLAIFSCVGIALAQAPSGPPKPGPEHQKLSYFAGKWSSEGETKESPFGPAGKFTFTQDCDWFEGNFALVCHSEGKMPQGPPVKGLSVMSYDPGEKTYTYYETNTMGETIFSRGMVEGDTWTWTSDNKMGGKTIHGRFTLKQLGADSASYKFELASGDEPMKVIMEGKQTRVKS